MKIVVRRTIRRVPLKVTLKITCHGRTVTLSRGQSWRCPSCGITYRA